MKFFQYQKSKFPAIAIAVIYLSVWVAILYGWVANIVKFIGILDNPITAMFIARLVGIFAIPLGVILGFV